MYYKRLIDLRKSHPAFRMGDAEKVWKHLEFLPVEGQNLIAFRLKDHANGDSWEDIIVAFNSRMTPCQAIKEYHALTGNKIGFKPAGGINCVNDALIYYTIVKEVLGEEWLNNGLFRLGTSRLANLLLSEIKGEEMKFF